jgi:hypothetical protein
MPTGVLRAACREAQRNGAFRRLVDNHEEFALVVGGTHFGNFAFN